MLENKRIDKRKKQIEFEKNGVNITLKFNGNDLIKEREIRRILCGVFERTLELEKRQKAE